MDEQEREEFFRAKKVVQKKRERIESQKMPSRVSQAEMRT